MYFDQEELREEIEEWLENDLKLADSESNRKERPWIINFSHFPFYCSSDNPTCASGTSSFSRLDDIIHKYNVDLFINAHVHKYERSYPVYKTYAGFDEVDKNTTFCDVYKNPRGTVFVTEGLPGNDKSSDENYEPKEFSKVVSDTKGYGVLRIINESTLFYERKDSFTGTIIDNFMI